ncbi:Ribonuclease H protein [Quillaja saponaria]|uniref:Ribonuclease H protein n=1 Tax=Quillaja saponaria TaxID=32244 RepID=A0AAD7L187_QUISA|nr:Ribonuclease H protein [Quillaja saponaria]
MRDCPSALNVWSSLVPIDLSNGFFSADFEDWLHMNLNSSIVFSKAIIPWPVMFSVVVWKIYKWRCKRIFDKEFSSPHNPKVVLTKYVKEIWAASVCNQEPSRKSYLFFDWNFPPFGWVKINCDGTAKSQGCLTSCGGLIRGDGGEWLGGFAANLGMGSNISAELYGIFHVLSLAWDLGFKSIILEIDSLTVVE